MRWSNTHFDKSLISILFWLFLCLHIAYKIWILLNAGFVYTDCDQGVLWLAARNFSEAQFMEPRFYGQNYNSSLEGLLAVPLFQLGIPLYKALPIVTSILASFPFLLLAFLCYSHGEKVPAVLILALSLCFPFSYDMLSGLPRGFVTGLALAAFNFILLFGSASTWKWILGGAASMIAVSLNPNSVLLIAPVYLALLPKIWNTKKYVLYLLAGALPFLVLHLLVSQFYASHPEKVIHEFEMRFDWELFKGAFGHLDNYIGILIPFFTGKSWLFFVLPLVGSTWLFYRRKQALAFAVLSVPILFCLTLLVSKVHDGNTSVYFSVSRMFLAIPVFWALLIKFLEPGKRFLFLSLGVLFVFPSKALDIKDEVAYRVALDNIISVRETAGVISECEKLKRLSDIYQTEIILVDDYLHQDMIDYTCPACIDSFPVILRPEYERKHWLLEANIKKIHQRILLITEPPDAVEALKAKGLELEFIEKNIYCIYDNTLPLYQLLETAGIVLPEKLKKPYGLSN